MLKFMAFMADRVEVQKHAPVMCAFAGIEKLEISDTICHRMP
jgi:hypothetical protein